MDLTTKATHKNSTTGEIIPNNIVYDVSLVAIDKDFFYVKTDYEYLYSVPVVTKYARECWQVKEV